MPGLLGGSDAIASFSFSKTMLVPVLFAAVRLITIYATPEATDAFSLETDECLYRYWCRQEAVWHPTWREAAHQHVPAHQALRVLCIAAIHQGPRYSIAGRNMIDHRRRVC